MNYNAYKKRFEGQGLSEQQIKRRYNDEMLFENMMRQRAIIVTTGGGGGGIPALYKRGLQVDLGVGANERYFLSAQQKLSVGDLIYSNEEGGIPIEDGDAAHLPDYGWYSVLLVQTVYTTQGRITKVEWSGFTVKVDDGNLAYAWFTKDPEFLVNGDMIYGNADRTEPIADDTYTMFNGTRAITYETVNGVVQNLVLQNYLLQPSVVRSPATPTKLLFMTLDKSLPIGTAAYETWGNNISAATAAEDGEYMVLAYTENDSVQYQTNPIVTITDGEISAFGAYNFNHGEGVLYSATGDIKIGTKLYNNLALDEDATEGTYQIADRHGVRQNMVVGANGFIESITDIT